jgi:putative hydrolase of the HAD superfamily
MNRYLNRGNKFKYIFFDWGGVLGTNKCEFVNSYAHRLDILSENFHKVITYLVMQGYHLGIISNTSVTRKPMESAMIKNNVYHLFDFMVLSSDEGMCKKNCNEIFLTAIEAAKVNPNECLYVGNSFENDMVGASNVGMYTCFLNNEGYDLKNKPDNINVDYTIDSIHDLWHILD